MSQETRPVGGYISGWFGVDTGVENIYRFESKHEKDGKEYRTAVIEFDRVSTSMSTFVSPDLLQVDHREIIRSPKFLSLLVNELVTAKKLQDVKNKLLDELDNSTGMDSHMAQAILETHMPAVPEKKAEEVTELVFTDQQMNRDPTNDPGESIRVGEKTSKVT